MRRAAGCRHVGDRASGGVARADRQALAFARGDDHRSEPGADRSEFARRHRVVRPVRAGTAEVGGEAAMTARRLDGKELAKAMRAEVAAKVAARTAAGQLPPGLAAVLVGDNPASHLYVRNKHKACKDAGLASWAHNLPADTT